MADDLIKIMEDGSEADSALEYYLNMQSCCLDFETLIDMDVVKNKNNDCTQDKEIDKAHYNGNGDEDEKKIIPEEILLSPSTPSIDDMIEEILEEYNTKHYFEDSSGLLAADDEPRVSDPLRTSNMIDVSIIGSWESDNVVKIELVTSQREANAINDPIKVLKLEENFVTSALLEMRKECERTADELKSEQAKHSQTKNELEYVQNLLMELKRNFVECSRCCSKFKTFSICEGPNQTQSIIRKLSEFAPDKVVTKESPIITGEEPDFEDRLTNLETLNLNIGLGYDVEYEISKFVEENNLNLEDLVSKQWNRYSRLSKTFASFKGMKASDFTSVVSKTLVSFLNGIVSRDAVLPMRDELQNKMMEFLPERFLRHISKCVRDSKLPAGKIHSFALNIREKYLCLKRKSSKKYRVKRLKH